MVTDLRQEKRKKNNSKIFGFEERKKKYKEGKILLYQITERTDVMIDV